MTNKNTDDDEKLSRRPLLKAAGSITGTASIANGIVRARPGTEYGTIRLLKVGVELDDLPALSKTGLYPTFHRGAPVDHVISGQQERLYLLSPADDRVVRMFKEESALVKGREFQPTPASLPDGPTDRIPTHLGPNHRRRYYLQLSDTYDPPEIQVNRRGETWTVTGSIRDDIPPNTARTYPLDSQEVSLRIERPTGEKVDRPDIPEHLRGVKIESWSETVRIAPTLHVVNHGKRKVIDATDELTVPR